MNVDMNFGRLLAKLPANTLVIFLTDNGSRRCALERRLNRVTVYEGGIRVPFYVRWDSVHCRREAQYPGGPHRYHADSA